MTNLLSTFQKIKDQDQLGNAYKRNYPSDDNPFKEKKLKVLTPKLSNIPVLREKRGSVDLSVRLHLQDRLEQLTNDETHQVHETQVHVEQQDHDHDDVSLTVLEEMNKLEECFPILSQNYRLIDKIGEGTFSTVYKAEALNGTIKLSSDIWKSPPLKRSAGKKQKSKNPIVALKQIYVTSSPNRIYNELNLLYILSGNNHIAPLLDVLRYQDQVLAILPYYPHADFRDFYRDLPIKGIKKYLWELFMGLEFVHNKGVIHRDLKPTNFLYDPFKGKGVLVDFGLAEKVNLNNNLNKVSNQCPCNLTHESKFKFNKNNKRLNIKAAYPKQDQRPARRANRAGTRGFRAPEVLFKCTNQTTSIDIWSAGIIGLSLLARKFPLFNSPDDTDALVELAIIFGVENLQKCSELHGCGLELNLNTKFSMNANIMKLVYDCLSYENKQNALPYDSVIHDTLGVLEKHGVELEARDAADSMYKDHKDILELLNGCFHMDATKRLTAKQILKLPFFDELNPNSDDDVIL